MKSSSGARSATCRSVGTSCSTTIISETVWGRGNACYRNNPYRTITSAKDFFGSDEAWKYQEKLYRYIIARWGYSRALFLWFVIDEINGTEGWAKATTRSPRSGAAR